MDASTFLQSVTGHAQAHTATQRTKMATIDPAYNPADFPGLLPRVTFDGESVLSGKRYAVLGSYTPQPGDPVLLVPAGRTYVIVGDIIAPATTGNIGFVDQAHVFDPDNAVNSIDAPVPADVVDGHLMVAQITAGVDTTITAPSGWDQLGTTRTDGNLATAVYVRVASSEPADYTWSTDNFTRVAGRTLAYRNVDTTTPIADVANTGTTTTDSSLTSPTVTMPTRGWLLLLVSGRRDSPDEPQSWSSSAGPDTKRGEVTGVGDTFQISSAAIDSGQSLSSGDTTRVVTSAQPWGQVGLWALALQPATS